MKKHLLVVLLILALCVTACGFAESGGRGYSFREDYDALDEAAKSLFYVEVYNNEFQCLASASGFICFDEHLFVTNYHVIDIEGAAFLRIWDDDDNRYLIEDIEAVDPEHDIAIMRFPDGIRYRSLELDTESELKRGQPVVTIGSPRGFQGTVAFGNLSAFPKMNEKGDFRMIQFTAPTSHGSSGGCLFDDTGKVIGITSAGSDDGQNIGFAVPSGYLRDLYLNWKEQAGKWNIEEVTGETWNTYFSLDSKCEYRDGKVIFRYTVSPADDALASAEGAPEFLSLDIRVHVYSSLKYAESEVDSRVISIPLEKAKGYRAEGAQEFTLEETLKSFFWDKEFEGLRAEESAPVTEAPAATEAPVPDGGEAVTETPEPAAVTDEPAVQPAGTAPADTEAPQATPVPGTSGNRKMINLDRDNFRDYFNTDFRLDYKDGKVSFRYAVSPVNGDFDAAEDTVTLELRLHLYSSLKYAESEIGSRVISIPLKREAGYLAEGTEEFTPEGTYQSIFWDKEIERVLIDGNDPAEGFALVTEKPPAEKTAAPQAAPPSGQRKDRARTELSADNFRDYFSVDCRLDYKDGKVSFRYAVSPSDSECAGAEGAADSITLEIRLYLYSSLKYSESEIGSRLITVTLEKDQQYCCEGTEEFTPEEEYKSIFWDKKIENASGWLMV